jgi:hypothetical protein
MYLIQGLLPRAHGCLAEIPEISVGKQMKQQFSGKLAIVLPFLVSFLQGNKNVL